MNRIFLGFRICCLEIGFLDFGFLDFLLFEWELIGSWIARAARHTRELRSAGAIYVGFFGG